MTFISPNDDEDTKEMMETIIPTTIKKSPRLRPRLEKPRRTPLKSNGGWTTAQKMKRNEENKMRYYQPPPQHVQEEEEKEEVQENNIEEILYEIFRRAEEEEEDVYESSKARKGLAYYFQGVDSIKDSYIDAEDPAEIYYAIDTMEEESQSESSSEREGIDYPDGEGDENDLDTY